MLLRLFFLACIGLCVGRSGIAAGKINFAVELKPAMQAQAAGDLAQAFSRYSQFSAHNPLAQFSLGLMYQKGMGRRADPVKACGWFEKAARGHIPVAQQFFADCLVQGIARPVDYTGALGWYKKAAAGGDLIALCSVADLLIQGKGAAKDVQLGLQHCMQAAQAGSPPAMRKMGDYFREGGDVPQDLAVARAWYRQAAEMNDNEARYQFGVMLSEGRGGEADVPTALFLLESAASAGYAPAYLPTAILYANAKPQAETGALSPEHLAKIYLWNSAAKAKSKDAAQQAEIARIESLVLSVMPATWRTDLDKKLAEHLARFN